MHKYDVIILKSGNGYENWQADNNKNNRATDIGHFSRKESHFSMDSVGAIQINGINIHI